MFPDTRIHFVRRREDLPQPQQQAPPAAEEVIDISSDSSPVAESEPEDRDEDLIASLPFIKNDNTILRLARKLRHTIIDEPDTLSHEGMRRLRRLHEAHRTELKRRGIFEPSIEGILAQSQHVRFVKPPSLPPAKTPSPPPQESPVPSPPSRYHSPAPLFIRDWTPPPRPQPQPQTRPTGPLRPLPQRPESSLSFMQPFQPKYTRRTKPKPPPSPSPPPPPPPSLPPDLSPPPLPFLETYSGSPPRMRRRLPSLLVSSSGSILLPPPPPPRRRQAHRKRSERITPPPRPKPEKYPYALENVFGSSRIRIPVSGEDYKCFGNALQAATEGTYNWKESRITDICGWESGKGTAIHNPQYTSLSGEHLTADWFGVPIGIAHTRKGISGFYTDIPYRVIITFPKEPNELVFSLDCPWIRQAHKEFVNYNFRAPKRTRTPTFIEEEEDEDAIETISSTPPTLSPDDYDDDDVIELSEPPTSILKQQPRRPSPPIRIDDEPTGRRNRKDKDMVLHLRLDANGHQDQTEIITGLELGMIDTKFKQQSTKKLLNDLLVKAGEPATIWKFFNTIISEPWMPFILYHPPATEDGVGHFEGLKPNRSLIDAKDWRDKIKPATYYKPPPPSQQQAPPPPPPPPPPPSLLNQALSYDARQAVLQATTGRRFSPIPQFEQEKERARIAQQQQQQIFNELMQQQLTAQRRSGMSPPSVPHLLTPPPQQPPPAYFLPAYQHYFIPPQQTLHPAQRRRGPTYAPPPPTTTTTTTTTASNPDLDDMMSYSFNRRQDGFP